MPTGVSCTVYVDGERLADGASGDDPLDPTALSGLGVVWGRTTSVDQPDSSTCEFDVADEYGGRAFLDLLHTGSRIDVAATGTQYESASVETIADGSFEAAPIGSTPAGRFTNATPTVAASGAVGVRTNLCQNPRPVTGSVVGWAVIASTVGSDGWITSTAPGATTTPYIFSAMASEAFAIGDVVTLSAKVRVPLAGTVPYLRLSVHTRSPNAYLRNLGVPVPATPGEVVPISITWTVDRAIAAGNLDLAMVPSAEGVGTMVAPAGWQMAMTEVLIERRPAPAAPFFDGDTPDVPPVPPSPGVPPVPGLDYAWTGAVRNSPSTATPTGITRFVRVIAPTSTSTSTLVFPPLPFSDLPDAWDGVPTTSAGQTWRAGITVTARAGAIITVQAVTFARPDALSELVPGALLRVTATGTPQVLAVDVPVAVAGRWVGVSVTVATAGLVWADAVGTWAEAAGTWQDAASFSLDDVTVKTPAAGTVRTVDVFSGRVTDLTASFDENLPGTVVHVTCADFTADLQNVPVGDVPWSVEGLGVRFRRVVDLTGLPVETVIDPSVEGVLLSYQDVDAQPAVDLLKDFSQSADAILWPAVHPTTGAYLWVEDPAARAALYQFALVDGAVVIVVGPPNARALDLSACNLLRDPVQWIQNVADVSTRADVGWLEQGVDDDGIPTTTERTASAVDVSLQAQFGQRRLSVSTLLQNAADATTLATRLLARTSVSGWRADGLVVDDPDTLDGDPTGTTTLLSLLDGTARIGMPIRLVDLPNWSPTTGDIPVYLEGGSYEFVDGAWTCSLVVSRASALGATATWEQMPAAWRWVDVDPAVSWADAIGVAAPTP